MSATIWLIALGHLVGAALLVTLGLVLDKRQESRARAVSEASEDVSPDKGESP